VLPVTNLCCIHYNSKVSFITVTNCNLTPTQNWTTSNLVVSKCQASQRPRGYGYILFEYITPMQCGICH